jgi:hypothetical protein
MLSSLRHASHIQCGAARTSISQVKTLPHLGHRNVCNSGSAENAGVTRASSITAPQWEQYRNGWGAKLWGSSIAYM